MLKNSILRKLKKSTAMKNAEALDYDETGRAVVNVGLREVEQFFHPCSFKTYDIVSNDVCEYVERFVDQIPVKDDICIDVYTEEETDNFDKKRMREAVKRNYAEKIVNLNKSMKRNLWFGVILLVLGIAFGALEFFIWSFWEQPLVDLIISIVAWTFFWDGFELLAIEHPQKRGQQIRNYRIMKAKVHVRQYSKTIKREFGIGEEEE